MGGVKNKPVTDKTYDNTETENKGFFYVLGVFFRKTLFAIWNCLNIIILYRSPEYHLKPI